MGDSEKKIQEQRNEDSTRNEQIQEFGQTLLTRDERDYAIYLMSIIGEIEGHECLPSTSKTTKYEHVLPKLAAVEDDEDVDGVLLLLNTVGGDVESGLAIAEMVASLSKPTVSLVLGGSHSIGVPLAVSTDYSLIVPTGTMVIQPVRMSSKSGIPKYASGAVPAKQATKGRHRKLRYSTAADRTCPIRGSAN